MGQSENAADRLDVVQAGFKCDRSQSQNMAETNRLPNIKTIFPAKAIS